MWTVDLRMFWTEHYIALIQMSAPCDQPWVTVQTRSNVSWSLIKQLVSNFDIWLWLIVEWLKNCAYVLHHLESNEDRTLISEGWSSAESFNISQPVLCLADRYEKFVQGRWGWVGKEQLQDTMNLNCVLLTQFSFSHFSFSHFSFLNPFFGILSVLKYST